MGQEIERKFLVRGEGWRAGAEAVLYRQGYLVSDVGCTIRVRVQAAQAFLTIKGKTEGIARLEYEYPLPIADANELLDRLCQRPLIEKYRYTVWYRGVKWEIDEFAQENAGLILAEVELASTDQVLELPEWSGREVSLDPRYFNSQLAKHPYSAWGTD